MPAEMKIPETLCPGCETRKVAVVSDTDDASMSEGESMQCMACGLVVTVVADGLRPATPEEVERWWAQGPEGRGW
jgi:hypothetical protein